MLDTQCLMSTKGMKRCQARAKKFFRRTYANGAVGYGFYCRRHAKGADNLQNYRAGFEGLVKVEAITAAEYWAVALTPLGMIR